MASTVNQHAEREAFLTRMVEELSTQRDIYQAIPGILEKTTRFFAFDCGFIFEADHTGKLGKKEFVAVSEGIGIPDDFLPGTCFTAQICDAKAPVSLYAHGTDDFSSPCDDVHSFRRFLGMGAVFLVPFLGQSGDLLGIAGMAARQDRPGLAGEELSRARLLFMVIANHIKMRAYHRQLENAKQSLSHTMDNTGVDIYVNDFHTHEILYVNKSMAAPYGGVENMLGKICYEVLYDGQKEQCEYCPQKKLLDENGKPTKIYSWDYCRPFDGAWFRVLSAAFTWVDGRQAHVVSSIDITDRKNYEAQLHEHEEALRKAVYAAEEATRMKSAFLANMSHEIRTPMNAIIGLAEIMLRSATDTDMREHVAGVKQAGKHLLSIINDILDLSKIESGRLELIPAHYSFASLVNDVINIIRVRIMEKPIVFTTNIDSGIPARLIGDAVRVRQVLLNILGNAVKYTDTGHISLHIGCRRDHETKSALLTITVADTGHGIRREDLDSLFDAFTRVEQNTRSGIEGTGLGLAITKNLCQSMGGDITAVSEYGRGSTFTIVLPQRFEDETPLAFVRDPETKPILLFEPDPYRAGSIAAACSDLHVPCTVAGTVAECARALRNADVRFVLAAVQMAEEAERLVTQLRPDVRIVVLSEYGRGASSSEYASLPLPVHSITLADLLNGAKDKKDTRAVTHMFVAPDVRVLITDDIETNLKVAAGLMAPYGMRVDVCRSGKETLELVSRHTYDIVFIDHMMPGMDGIETAAAIRSMEHGDGYYRNLPLIALTANVAFGAREMLLQNHMNDFLAKPIEMNHLNEILDRWIPSARKKPVTMTLSPDQTGNLPLIRGLDVEHGLRQTGGIPAVYMSVLRTFHGESARIGEELAASLREKNLDLFTQYVHSLKSAAGSIGAGDLYQQAQALEHAGHLKDMPFIESCVDGFLSGLKALLNNISPFVQSGCPVSGTGVDMDAVRGRMRELLEALRALNLNRVDKITATLLADNACDPIRGKLDEICDDILLSAFVEAEEKILKLLVQ